MPPSHIRDPVSNINHSFVKLQAIQVDDNKSILTRRDYEEFRFRDSARDGQSYQN